MKITAINRNGQATLTICGRMDTSATAQATAEIDSQLAACGKFDTLTCDAAGLEYISSSGLRILLGLAKRYPGFRVTEVCPDVYQVLEMTGFTKIMNVEKAMRRFSVDGCQVIGRGGVGVVYRIDDDTIIKVFREGTTIDEVQCSRRILTPAWGWNASPA